MYVPREKSINKLRKTHSLYLDSQSPYFKICCVTFNRELASIMQCAVFNETLRGLLTQTRNFGVPQTIPSIEVNALKYNGNWGRGENEGRRDGDRVFIN